MRSAKCEVKSAPSDEGGGLRSKTEGETLFMPKAIHAVYCNSRHAVSIHATVRLQFIAKRIPNSLATTHKHLKILRVFRQSKTRRTGR